MPSSRLTRGIPYVTKTTITVYWSATGLTGTPYFRFYWPGARILRCNILTLYGSRRKQFLVVSNGARSRPICSPYYTIPCPYWEIYTRTQTLFHPRFNWALNWSYNDIARCTLWKRPYVYSAEMASKSTSPFMWADFGERFFVVGNQTPPQDLFFNCSPGRLYSVIKIHRIFIFGIKW